MELCRRETVRLTSNEMVMWGTIKDIADQLQDEASDPNLQHFAQELYGYMAEIEEFIEE